MFLKKGALVAAVCGVLLTGCTSTDDTDPKPETAASTDTAASTPNAAKDLFGDTDEELAVAQKWGLRWCQVHMGDTKEQVLAAMGKTRRGFSGEDALFWGDANYQFQANLNDKDIVVGHASALPPKVTDAIRDQFDCAHG